MSAEVKFEPLSFDDVKSRLAGPEDKASPRTLVVFAGAELAFGAATKALLAGAADQIARAAAYAKFTGKSGSALEILAPAGLPGASRLLLLGTAAAAGDGAQAEKPKTPDSKTPDSQDVRRFSDAWRPDHGQDRRGRQRARAVRSAANPGRRRRGGGPVRSRRRAARL